MTRTYQVRAPDGRLAVVSFRIRRERRAGFMAEYRATCARILLDWTLLGYTLVRRLPPRRLGRNPRAIQIVEP